MNSCPICKSKSTHLYNLFDDRYGYEGIFSQLKCKKCNHKYLSEKFTTNEIDNLYTEFYPRSSFDVNQFAALKKEPNRFIGWLNGENSTASFWVPKGSKVLDIGCGCGESLAYHKEMGSIAFGVDADKNVQKVKDKYNLNITIGSFNSNMFEKNYFDCITLQQVIEHMINPIHEVKDIAKTLKPNGIVVFTTPNSNSFLSKVFKKKWIHWHTPYHLNLFNQKSMKILADKCSFKLIKSKSITHSDWLYYQLNHLIFYPQQGQKSFFWAYSEAPNINLSKKISFMILKIIYKLKILHFISRIIDTCNAGDNKLYILKKSNV